MRRHLKSRLALAMPSLALVVPSPDDRFPNKLALKVANILRNLHFGYFASFSIVSLTPFTNKPHPLYHSFLQ